MTTEAAPRTSAEIGGMGHSVKRKEDPRFIRGAGEYIDDVNLPGQLWLDTSWFCLLRNGSAAGPLSP